MRKLIFISNDDGYFAKGLNSLVEMVRPLGDVFVVAPESPQSGASMSFSANKPLRNKLIKEEGCETVVNADGSEVELGSVTVWSCSGTPIDCVKMAYEVLLPRRPDVVLGGINHGHNAGVNAHYSGTISIIFEGCIKETPSIAFSSGMIEADADFSAMTPWVQHIVSKVLSEGLPQGVCLNVNAPAMEAFRGIRIGRMGFGDWHNEIQESTHPHGWKYYWVAGNFVPTDADDVGTDMWAYDHGYIAITPLQLDLTAHRAMEGVRLLVKNEE